MISLNHLSSKILLRAGIILMGLRLNFSQIVEAGFSIVFVDVIVIVFTLTLMIYLGKLFSVDKYLSALIAVGTAVCGAAAIVAAVARKERGIKDLPIPWFIFGFFIMCLVNTIGLLSDTITQMFIALSVFLLSMAMAGLGLSIHFGDFKKVGYKAILIGIIGFIALTAISPLLLKLI